MRRMQYLRFPVSMSAMLNTLLLITVLQGAQRCECGGGCDLRCSDGFRCGSAPQTSAV